MAPCLSLAWPESQGRHCSTVGIAGVECGQGGMGSTGVIFGLWPRQQQAISDQSSLEIVQRMFQALVILYPAILVVLVWMTFRAMALLGLPFAPQVKQVTVYDVLNI